MVIQLLATALLIPRWNHCRALQKNKRLELVRELIPKAGAVALLVNPTNPGLAEPFIREVKVAASSLGLHLHILQARAESGFEPAFERLAPLRADALVIMPDGLFNSHSKELAALSLRYRIPTIFQYRPFAEAGGLVSYSSDENEYYRQVGRYAARVLKGDTPADLPIQRSTKVELIINLKTAKRLGITVPQSMQSRADDVLE
jgi:ABC-type uncharacterized transport system substrate-binding protein